MNNDLTSIVRDEIFKSIHLISDAKLRNADFTSFLYSTISYIDASNPYHYKVRYQGQDIDVYSSGGQTYNLGDNVVILYSNSDFTKQKFILGFGTNAAASTVLKSQIYYGSFYSSQNQSAAATNTEYKYTFNSINQNYGILLGDGITTGPTGATSVMRIQYSGVYNMQYNIQLQNSDNAEQRAIIWLKKNNINLSNSAAVIDIPKNKGTTTTAFGAFRNFSVIGEFSANDTLEIAYSYSSTQISVWSQVAGTTWAASPSVYANIHLVK